MTTLFGEGAFAVATDGTLVYVDAPGGRAGTARTLVWVDGWAPAPAMKRALA